MIGCWRSLRARCTEPLETRLPLLKLAELQVAVVVVAMVTTTGAGAVTPSMRAP
jgi:hypothetical protein